MLYDDKSINDIEYQIYNKWFNEYSNNKHIYHYIYIDTPSDKCFERINLRARKGETIPLKYLNKCKKYHDEWLTQEQNILTVTGDEDIIDKEKYNNILNIIIKYIKYTIENDNKLATKAHTKWSDTNFTLEDLMNHPFF